MFKPSAEAWVGRRAFLASLGAGGILTAATACTPEGAADAEFTITTGHASTEDHFHHLSLEHFKDLIEEGSDGQIAVHIHPNAVFGDDREIIESCQLDNLQTGLPATAPLAGFIRDITVWEIPFLFDDTDHAYRALDSDFGRSILDQAENHGLIGLEYWENGFRHLTTRSTAVEDPDDVQNLSVRTMESPAHLQAWGSVGANPTPMAFGEVYVGLQQGTIHAQENPLPLIEAQRFYEVQDYLIRTGHVYGPSPFIMSKAFYDSLPSSLQDLVREAAAETRDYCRQEAKIADENALETIRDSGTEIIELDQEQREAFGEIMREGAENYVRSAVGDETLEDLYETVEEAR